MHGKLGEGRGKGGAGDSESEEEGEVCVPYDIQKGRNTKIKDFKIREMIGEGTFGKVFLSYDKTGSRIALKRIALTEEREGIPLSIIREIQILKTLRHPNLIEVIDIVSSIDTRTVNNTFDIYVSFPYMVNDLLKLIKSRELLVGEVLQYTAQILQGLCYLHSRGIIHRDLKPANVLIDAKGTLKITDFGLSRFLPKKGGMTPGVVTRWYRSPELLLGTDQYSTSVDIWSCGCIVGEMMERSPLFMGKSEINQLELIISLCGSVDNVSLPGASFLPEYNKYALHSGRNRVKEYFGSYSSTVAELLSRILVINPLERITAQEALRLVSQCIADQCMQ